MFTSRRTRLSKKTGVGVTYLAFGSLSHAGGLTLPIIFLRDTTRSWRGPCSNDIGIACSSELTGATSLAVVAGAPRVVHGAGSARGAPAPLAHGQSRWSSSDGGSASLSATAPLPISHLSSSHERPQHRTPAQSESRLTPTCQRVQHAHVHAHAHAHVHVALSPSSRRPLHGRLPCRLYLRRLTLFLCGWASQPSCCRRPGRFDFVQPLAVLKQLAMRLALIINRWQGRQGRQGRLRHVRIRCQ